MKLAEATSKAQPTLPPDCKGEELRNLCLDKGYDYEEVKKILKAWGYVGHISPPDEPERIIHEIPNYRARPWVLERIHSWMKQFRRVLIRWEKKPENYLGMLHLVCACIAVRAIQVFG